MEYILVILIIVLLLFSPKTNSMLSGDNTTEAPKPKISKEGKNSK